MNLKAKLGLVCAALFSCALLLQPAIAFAAPKCKVKSLARTGGTAKTIFLAKKRARDAWRNTAVKRYGRKWSAWYQARNSHYTCFKENRRNRCTARGVPCRSVVIAHGPGKVCAFYKIAATATANTKGRAKRRARRAWRTKAQEFHGRKFDTWLLGNNRTTRCRIRKGKHACTATATPCRVKLLR